MAERTEPATRFWSKVDRDGPMAANRPDLGPCWLWTGSTFKSGYGMFKVDGRNARAHRWLWELENGPVPVGLELDHFACDRRACVNPSHMEPVTHAANMARGAHAAKTHCPAGHPYDEANTILDHGRRRCRVCTRSRGRLAQRAARARRRAN